MTIAPELREGLIQALPNLRAFAVSLTGNPDRADDLVQDTLVKAMGAADRFEPGSNLHAWLFTILRNQFFSSFRRSKREVEDPEGVHAAGLVSIPEQEAKLSHQDLWMALQKLRVDQREALLLVGAQGFSYEDAAEITGVALGTMKSRVHRARVELAKLLGFTETDDLGGDRLMKAAMSEATNPE